jgi:hypothetical protein
VARSARACNFRNKRSGATDFVEVFCSVSELARQKVLRVGRRQGKARGLSDRAVLCMEKQCRTPRRYGHMLSHRVEAESLIFS